jgi:hypothetical protein
MRGGTAKRRDCMEMKGRGDIKMLRSRNRLCRRQLFPLTASVAALFSRSRKHHQR